MESMEAHALLLQAQAIVHWLQEAEEEDEGEDTD